MMDSSEFSASENEEDEMMRAESSSMAEERSCKLDLARVVRVVDPAVSNRTRARSESHGVRADLIERYVVYDWDLSRPGIELAPYHMKLLTPTDIAHIFKGISRADNLERDELRQILEVELRKGSYLILLSDEANVDAATHRVATVQVAPCATNAMARLGIGFALIIRFHGGTMRVINLNWTLSEDRDSLLLEPAEADVKDNEIVVVSNSEDELVFFDVHFTRKGVCLPDFVVMRASMTVGVYARAVTIDKAVISKVLDRLYTPSTRFVTNSVSLESFERATSTADGVGGTQSLIPAMTEPPTGNPSTLMMSSRHYLQTEDYSFSAARALAPYEHWQNVTKTYRTNDGWYHIIPGTALNRSFKYSAAELTCKIYVNIDDSIHQANDVLYREVYAKLAERHQRHCTNAVKYIIQMSEPVRMEFDDSDEMAYLTTDEGHVRAVDASKRDGKLPRGADAAEFLATKCYMIHRYRKIFDANAFSSVVIPLHIARVLASPKYEVLLASDKIEVEQYISRYIIDGLIAREMNGELDRKVYLPGWKLQCPVSFVGATLTRMIDSDIYNSIWERNQVANAQLQRTFGAAQNAAGMQEGSLWRLVRSVASLFGGCSSASAQADKK